MNEMLIMIMVMCAISTLALLILMNQNKKLLAIAAEKKAMNAKKDFLNHKVEK